MSCKWLSARLPFPRYIGLHRACQRSSMIRGPGQSTELSSLYRLLGLSLYRVPIATWNKSAYLPGRLSSPRERGSIELFRGETAATGGKGGRIARPKGAHVSWFTDICIICVIDPSFHARERFLAPRRARSSPSAFPPCLEEIATMRRLTTRRSFAGTELAKLPFDESKTLPAAGRRWEGR